MIKAIIQIRGYNTKKSIKLRKSIIKFMKKTKIKAAVSCEIVPTKVFSCDGNNTPEPYVQIVAEKRKYAANIIEEFKKNMIHELIVLSMDNTFCGAGEIASGR